jgi:ABC-type dipeptide/oligopeptide/nickel transport system permease subunit
VPIFAMFLTVMALNFAGDRIREYTDVRETAF